MFDFAHPLPTMPPRPASVLFLSNPFGATREWRGLSGCFGTRAVCRSFARGDEMSAHAETVAGGLHIVAHGTGAFHALRVAQ